MTTNLNQSMISKSLERRPSTLCQVSAALWWTHGGTDAYQLPYIFTAAHLCHLHPFLRANISPSTYQYALCSAPQLMHLGVQPPGPFPRDRQQLAACLHVVDLPG